MSIVDKVKSLLGQHSDKAREGMERAGDKIDEKTGGRYSDQIHEAEGRADEYVDRGRQGDADRPG
ncbi:MULTISPECIES: antitoxin [Actinomadura]|uniref:Antitoxin n=1 Tax=Actinomadura miaoliensis TaxID=430685 RepID=A0ABP7W3G4_9ACTN